MQFEENLEEMESEIVSRKIAQAVGQIPTRVDPVYFSHYIYPADPVGWEKLQLFPEDKTLRKVYYGTVRVVASTDQSTYSSYSSLYFKPFAYMPSRSLGSGGFMVPDYASAATTVYNGVLFSALEFGTIGSSNFIKQFSITFDGWVGYYSRDLFDLSLIVDISPTCDQLYIL